MSGLVAEFDAMMAISKLKVSLCQSVTFRSGDVDVFQARETNCSRVDTQYPRWYKDWRIRS